MLKSRLLLIAAFVIVGLATTNAGIYYLIPESDAVYSIPPTPAIRSLTLNDTLATQGDTLIADTSSFNLHIISDGSIIIERGVGGLP